MRQCYKCKETKNLDEFHNDRTQSQGKSYVCKICKSLETKLKREANPEKYREKNRRSLEKNYETIRASQKRFRILNREKILKKRKEQRLKRKDEINERESIRLKERRKTDPLFVERERKKQRERYAKKKAQMLPKHNAHKLVMFAIKLGVLKKPLACSRCNSSKKIEGHHEDYSKPLEVVWLCKSCHVLRHTEMNKINS